MILGLKQGDRGAYVELIQLALLRAGYAVSIDGIFGEATRSALENFQVANRLDVTGVVDAPTETELLPYLKGYREVIVRPGDSFYSLARKYETTVFAIRRANEGIDPRNLAAGSEIIVPLGFDLVATNIHYTYYYLSILMDGLQARFPFCEITTIGKTQLGKNIYCMGIGMGDMHLMYNASHHANEWITTPLVLKFFEDYAIAVSGAERIYKYDALALYFKTHLEIIPMVDADGVDLVNGVVTEDALEGAQYIAAAFPNIPFPAGWKANIGGVDLNLNYPAQWERAKQIKFAQGFDKPAPRDYVGPRPLSEPESLTMEQHTRKNNYLLTISYHTQGRVIYWKFDDYLPPRSREIGEAFAAASGYTLEITPAASGAAGYKDWFIQEYNRPGYTVEVGLGQNPLPLSQFDEIYKNNLGIMTLGMYLL